MRLHDLLGGIGEVDPARATGPVDITSITNDSRRVEAGALFACIPGDHVDGHAFAADAVRGGARALLVEHRLDAAVVGDVVQIRVPSVRAVLGPLAARLYDDPSRSLQCLGVTGTNGKTTTTFLLEAIARSGGLTAGVVGTVGARVAGKPVASAQITPTTPEACDLQRLLADMRDAGAGVVAIEVSSHALQRREVDGTRFAAVCFTNLSHEHLDYHGTLDDYFEAKARLFDGTFSPAAAVNVDDAHGREIARRVTQSGRALWDFGMDFGIGAAHLPALAARDVDVARDGTTFTLVDRDADRAEVVRTSLVGPFNVSNALAAAATARASGIALDVVLEGLGAPQNVPGRMEPVERGQDFTVLVDYAHTPDALTRVLAAARALAGGGRVIAVFGAGGDRDRAKRPLMGRAVAEGADLAVLTSDNPRSEPPDAIAAAVRTGLDAGPARVVVELDRRRAIALALEEARTDDVVVIAGKGHERGQTVGARTFPFEDRVVAAEELEAAGWS